MFFLRVLSIALTFCISLTVFAADRPSCRAIFPEYEPIHVNGAISMESVRCYDSSDPNNELANCANSRFTEPSPVIPNDIQCKSQFKSGNLVGGSVQCFNGWKSSNNKISVSGEGTAVVYIKQNGNDIVLNKNAEINAGGDPSKLLIIIQLKNGIFKIEKGNKRTPINAFMYIKSKNGGDTVFEENIDFAGHLSVEENLQIKKNSTYTYYNANVLDDNSFCVAEEEIVPQPVFSCLNTFVDGATTHSTNGVVGFSPNSFLFDNPDAELASKYVLNGSTSFTCWSNGANCYASGQPITALTLGTFLTTDSNTSKTVGIGNPQTIGENGDNEYGHITLNAGAELTTSNLSSVYKIKTLNAGNRDSRLNLAPGDYYIENIILGVGTRVNMTSSGETRIFVKNSFLVGSSSHINANAPDDHHLILVSYGDVSLASSVRVNARVYAQGNAVLIGAVHLTGAVSAANIGLAPNARIYYQCGINPPIAVNHYQIRHDSQGLTCATETVEILACTNDYDSNNPSCDLSNENISLDFIVRDETGQQVVKQAVSFNQQGQVSFNYGEVGKVSFSLANENITANAGIYCNDNSADSCDMTFSNAGFIFNTINNQVAGETFNNIEIQAVHDEQGVCTALPLTNSVDVGFAIEHHAPREATSLTYQINGIEIDKHINNTPTTYTPVPVQFDAQAKAIINNHVYFDAGQISLHARYVHNVADEPAFTIQGHSNDFWVTPEHFEITAKNSDNVPLNNSNTRGGTTHAAGDEFIINIAAKNKQGITTSNYRSITSAIKLAHIEPNNAFVGSLTYSLSGAVLSDDNYVSTQSVDFKGNSQRGTPSGEYRFEESYYSETGIVKLSFQDSGYGDGMPRIIPSGTLTIGRFIPDHFFLEVSADVENACLDMTYMDQPELNFSYQLEARNTKEGVTKNYQGEDYSQISFIAKSGDTNVSHRLADFGANWLAGIYQSDETNLVYDSGKFTRALTPDGPFEQTIFAIKIEDDDGVLLKDLDINADFIGDCDVLNPSACNAKKLDDHPSKIYFARWVIDNSFAPETADLAMPMRIEYLSNTGNYQTVTTDNCTAISSENNEVVLYERSLSPDDVSVAAITTTFAGGESDDIVLNAPNIQGDILVEYQTSAWFLYDWDNDGAFDNFPNAIATFGRYRGNDRVIIWREVTP